MRGPGKTPWLKTGVFGGLICLAVYGLVALEAGRKGPGERVPRTTYSAAARGYKALFLWLETSKVPVMRWEKSLVDLPRKPALLVIVDPELGPDPGELDALSNWVSRGGNLFLAMRPPNVFLSHFGLEPAPVRKKPERETADDALARQPGPYTRGVTRLMSRGHPGLASSRPRFIVHGRDAWGPVIGAVGEAGGTVVALADPDILSNGELGKADHSRLAFNILLTLRQDGPVLVDEYHHGYGRATSVLGYFRRSRALVPTLQGVFLVLVLWAMKGRRFGPPRSLVKEKRRSSMEYVNAMAQLFQRARARALALRSVRIRIEERARRFLVEGDRALQMRVKEAERRERGEGLTDRELLMEARGLYEALARARRGPGQA